MQMVSRPEVSILTAFQNKSKHLGGYSRSMNTHHIIILLVSASSQFDTAEP